MKINIGGGSFLDAHLLDDRVVFGDGKTNDVKNGNPGGRSSHVVFPSLGCVKLIRLAALNILRLQADRSKNLANSCGIYQKIANVAAPIRDSLPASDRCNGRQGDSGYDFNIFSIRRSGTSQIAETKAYKAKASHELTKANAIPTA
jgi:hypothetical protein